MMQRAALSALLLALALPPGMKSSAQALPTATGPGGYIAVGGALSIYQADYGTFYLLGPTAWVDANIHRYVGIEAEARFLRYHKQDDISQDTYLVGPRYSFKPSHLVPYVKILAGDGRMVFPYHYAKGNYFVFAPGGGLDYWIPGSRVNLRLVDVEYQIWPQFTFGPLHPYGITTGLSVRIR